ncbi:hypothetical protein JP008_00260 [Staphylococcus aureus]|nr:hypothetical protein JP008_00260 [Staphylococcus aureus]
MVFLKPLNIYILLLNFLQKTFKMRTMNQLKLLKVFTLKLEILIGMAVIFWTMILFIDIEVLFN